MLIKLSDTQVLNDQSGNLYTKSDALTNGHMQVTSPTGTNYFVNDPDDSRFAAILEKAQ